MFYDFFANKNLKRVVEIGISPSFILEALNKIQANQLPLEVTQLIKSIQLWVIKPCKPSCFVKVSEDYSKYARVNTVKEFEAVIGYKGYPKMYTCHRSWINHLT